MDVARWQGLTSLMASAVLAAALALAPLTACAAPARLQAPAPMGFPAPARVFQQVRGDIWRVGNGNWWSLIYVTPDGIVLVDPISVDFAQWMKGELARRFPDRPVRYIVYSHSHWDHVAGAAVYADSHPHIVAQERVLKNMDGRWPHMPGDLRDRNNNGTLEPEEMMIPTMEHPGICGMGPTTYATYDTQHTGHITPAQWFKDIPKPDIVYSERMTILLGGRTIELVFPGLNHADDGTVVHFPAERVVFSTDFPADALVTTTMRSMPSSCGVFDQHPMADWIKSYRTIEALDFDILAQAHGQRDFTKQDVVEGRQFFEDLRDAVSQGMAQGKSLAELKQSIKLEKYKDWAYYDQLLPEDVEAAYRNLRTYP